jgi:hypothetical protein
MSDIVAPAEKKEVLMGNVNWTEVGIVLFACFGFFVFVSVVLQTLARLETTWDIVAEGVVAEMWLKKVERGTVSSDGRRFVSPSALETVVTFADGTRVALPDNHLHDCKNGDCIRVKRNRVDDYRIEFVNG